MSSQNITDKATTTPVFFMHTGYGEVTKDDWDLIVKGWDYYRASEGYSTKTDNETREKQLADEMAKIKKYYNKINGRRYHKYSKEEIDSHSIGVYSNIFKSKEFFDEFECGTEVTQAAEDHEKDEKKMKPETRSYATWSHYDVRNKTNRRPSDKITGTGQEKSATPILEKEE